MIPWKWFCTHCFSIIPRISYEIAILAYVSTSLHCFKMKVLPHCYSIFPSNIPPTKSPLKRPGSCHGSCWILQSASYLCVSVCVFVCVWHRRTGGRHLLVFDWRWLQSQPLCPTWVLPLYGESRLICQVLTSVSSLFWVVSPHPSWPWLLKAAVQQSHLFQLPAEIGWKQRGSTFYATVAC